MGECGVRPASILAGLFVVALTLRPQIVGVGPLFPDIESGLDTTHAVVGLLGTIPVLCMGIFAPPAAYLSARVGTRTAITVSVLLVGVFGLARAFAPSALLLILLTWPVGAGMGLAGAVVPVAVKERFPLRPAGPTGVYTTGIQVGSALSAFVVVPLAAWYGGWRASLAVISIVSIVLAGVWVLLTRHEPAHERRLERPPRLPWRSRVAWLLVAIFALMASTYYGINAWLPDSYVERGWSSERAGSLLALLNFVAIPASFVIPWLSDRVGGRRVWLAAMAMSFVIGAFGVVLLPAAAYVWVIALGLASGSMFALVLTLPLDLEDDPGRVGALVGMMLGLGYTIGAISPVALGAVRDVTGDFTASLWLIAGFAGLLVASVAAIPARAERRAAG
jgi:CP family cyanate transporter-like MFS transporter